MPKFTDMLLKSLKTKDKKYFIRETTGFALRIMPTGSKTFLYIYEVEGKRKELNLGLYPQISIADARGRYHEATDLRYKGIDPKELNKPAPSAPEDIPELLMSALVETYVKWSEENHCARHSHDKGRTLANHLLPLLGSKPVTSIKRRDIIAFMTLLRDNGVTRGALRNVYRAVSSMFEFAVQNDHIEVSPFHSLRKLMPYVSVVDRTRNLSEAEVSLVWGAIDKFNARKRSKEALKMVLVTAQRPGEVCEMQWNEVSGDWWTIPPEKNKKGKRYHMVYLSKTAKGLMGDRAEGFVFKSDKVTKGDQHLSITTLQKIARNIKVCPGWTPHDLRRTARTHMSRLRIPREHAEAVLNHSKSGMVKVYDQYEYMQEKKEALQIWEAELMRLVGQ